MAAGYWGGPHTSLNDICNRIPYLNGLFDDNLLTLLYTYYKRDRPAYADDGSKNCKSMKGKVLKAIDLFIKMLYIFKQFV